MVKVHISEGPSVAYKVEWSFVDRTRSQAYISTALQPGFLWQRLCNPAYPGA